MNAADEPSPPPAADAPPSAATLTILALILALGATVRIATASGSLWLDELHTAWTVQAEWQDLLPRAAIGNQSPAFFAIVKASVDLFGTCEWTLRLPSLVAGAGLIALAWWAIRQWTGSDVAAIFTALAVAFDPWCVLFSAEARTYAVVHLVGLAHLLVFSELLAEPTWTRRIVWMIGGALLFYLHYTAALLIAAEVAAFVVLRGSGRGENYPVRLLVIDLFAMGALCLPARDHLAQIAARRGDWAQFIGEASFAGFFQLFPLYAAVVALVAGIALWQMLRGNTSPGDEPKESPAPRDVVTPWILVAAWLVVPLALALGATVSDQARLLFLRYMSPALVAVPLFAGLALASFPSNWLRSAAGAVLLAALLLFPARWPIDSTPVGRLLEGGGWVPHGGQDWRSAVAFISDQDQDPANRRLAVCVRSGFIEADRLISEPQNELLKSYCLSPANSLYRVEAAGRTLIPLATKDLGPLDADALRALQYRDQAWLLLIGSRQDAEVYVDLLDAALEEHGSRVLGAEYYLFPGVTVSKVKISQGP